MLWMKIDLFVKKTIFLVNYKVGTKLESFFILIFVISTKTNIYE
jgi:hypothetical protein